MRKWNLFTFWVYVAFGALAAVCAVAALGFLIAGMVGGTIVLLIVAAVLGIMSWSTKRSYDSMTRADG